MTSLVLCGLREVSYQRLQTVDLRVKLLQFLTKIALGGVDDRGEWMRAWVSSCRRDSICDLSYIVWLEGGLSPETVDLRVKLLQ